ncbi:MAG: hypothetical protein FWE98_07855 [Oscillospiraceae bacterium]|nr:hypothetical protein [Oscillospiraceae bacterium]
MPALRESISFSDINTRAVTLMPSPGQVATWVHLAALELARGKNADELALLGAALSQLGSVLTTLSAQKSLFEEKQA